MRFMKYFNLFFLKGKIVLFLKIHFTANVYFKKNKIDRNGEKYISSRNSISLFFQLSGFHPIVSYELN